jgi:hypothetical protein
MLPSTWRTRRRRRRAVSEANKELVRRHFEEIFNRKNFAVCEEMMAEEYFEHAPAPFSEDAPGKVNGPKAMRQTAEWLLGPLNGVVPPTGKRFSARQSHWYRVVDGKLVEHWATREDLPAMLQLGVIRPPGDGPPS